MNKQNLTILTLSLAIFMVVSGCATKQTKENQTPANNPTQNQVATSSDLVASSSDAIDTSDWKTYRNDEYGFELKYPKNWRISNGETKNAVFLASNYFNNNGEKNGGFLEISVFKNSNDENLKKWAEKYLEEVSSYKKATMEETMINGVRAIYAKCENNVLFFDVRIVEHDGEFFVLTSSVSIDQDMHEEIWVYDNQIKDMVSSLYFNKTKT